MLKPRKALALAALITGLFTYTFHEQAIAKPGPSFIGTEGHAVALDPRWKSECLKARAFSYLELPRAERANEFCTVRFRNAGILEDVERRWLIYLSGSAATLVLAVLAIRALLNEPAPIIVRRGPRVLRGRAGRRALARTAKSESRGDERRVAISARPADQPRARNAPLSDHRRCRLRQNADAAMAGARGDRARRQDADPRHQGRHDGDTAFGFYADRAAR